MPGPGPGPGVAWAGYGRGSTALQTSHPGEGVGRLELDLAEGEASLVVQVAEEGPKNVVLRQDDDASALEVRGREVIEL